MFLVLVTIIAIIIAVIIIMKLSSLTERETRDSPSFCEAIILLSSDR